MWAEWEKSAKSHRLTHLAECPADEVAFVSRHNHWFCQLFITSPPPPCMALLSPSPIFDRQSLTKLSQTSVKKLSFVALLLSMRQKSSSPQLCKYLSCMKILVRSWCKALLQPFYPTQLFCGELRHCNHSTYAEWMKNLTVFQPLLSTFLSYFTSNVCKKTCSHVRKERCMNRFELNLGENGCVFFCVCDYLVFTKATEKCPDKKRKANFQVW